MSEITIKERPILYSGAMVRGILSGQKNQTRRLIKGGWTFEGDESGCCMEPPECRYGQVGDRLWVRESWCVKEESLGVWRGDPEDCWYQADGVEVRAVDDDGFQRYRKDGTEASPWKSSRFMPRWACRLVLEITDVRVEQLQEITEKDIIAEGIKEYALSTGLVGSNRALWIHLWNSINPDHPWVKNPWIWVITFRRTETADATA